MGEDFYETALSLLYFPLFFDTFRLGVRTTPIELFSFSQFYFTKCLHFTITWLWPFAPPSNYRISFTPLEHYRVNWFTRLGDMALGSLIHSEHLASIACKTSLLPKYTVHPLFLLGKKKKEAAFREISLISDSWLRRSRKGLGHKVDTPGSLGIMVTRGTSPLEEKWCNKFMNPLSDAIHGAVM